MDHEQPPTNQTINATQMERAPSKIPRDNLNISCDFSDTTSNNPSSYTSFAIRRRRNQRRLRHGITINTQINARNVIITIRFLIANEYLIFMAAYQKILQLAYTEEFLEIIAHDKLSIKFKEIAEGSKKLSVKKLLVIPSST
ncbi:hypothetical protein RhiirA4_468269 [Rhizophagus irregularis]|uniref:Signal recognition particle receptor alpha subunit N-terminal domain-containing protein n=1 Tax=Rhizophagus irregularis TaxID=588596 RepID=A0A2I1GXF0_9GLOM|nr:hypothetical protein RhiirA4_468269 [Rhizophagus irregularis]